MKNEFVKINRQMLLDLIPVQMPNGVMRTMARRSVRMNRNSTQNGSNGNGHSNIPIPITINGPNHIVSGPTNFQPVISILFKNWQIFKKLGPRNTLSSSSKSFGCQN
jgi:hypothetical protein